VKNQKPLWKCPSCGEEFVTRNMAHSCGHHAIEDHFRGKDPHVRELFDALLRATQSLGPVHAYAQKSRIVFQTRGRFVAITPRKHHLAGHLWLKRRRQHPLVYRVESLLDRDYVHNFRLTSTNQIDSSFRELLQEAYAVGSQEPVTGQR
jgi:Domain of unknown function (DUF5655)